MTTGPVKPELGTVLAVTSGKGGVGKTNVVVNDPLPAGLILVSASPSQGTYDSGTGNWALASLGNGATATLIISAQVVASAGWVARSDSQWLEGLHALAADAELRTRLGAVGRRRVAQETLDFALGLRKLS